MSDCRQHFKSARMKSNQPKFIKQYASGVIDFSSQYGGENPRSVSYSVANIAGEPRIFPSYGDFTQAAVFRTYGPWWKDKNEASKASGHPREKNFYSEDYIDLVFDQSVYPWSIAIFETYNPGAVVRILALRQSFPVHNIGLSQNEERPMPVPVPFAPGCSHWEILWECSSPEQNLPSSSNEARMFAPILNEMKHLTRIIRLEFCSTHLQYYTELDAVELTGTLTYYPSTSVDPPVKLFEELKIVDDGTVKSYSNKMKDISRNKSKNDTISDKSKVEHNNGYFDNLPPELLCYIFSFLPLMDLCRCARVCKLFHELSYDPSWFNNIDLRSCWHLINDDALECLVTHCNPKLYDVTWEDNKSPPTPQVQSVNLSWCGGGGIVSSGSLVNFVANCGSHVLTHLSLASCPIVSDEVLSKISHYCPNLQHLNIWSCDAPTSEGLRILHNLTKLEYVNFYRTKIDDAGILCILHSNPNLQSINLGSCICILDFDRILVELSQHCPKIRSLDCWRAKSLTSHGLNSLTTSCNFIEELDLGWCGGLQSSSGCFQILASNCPHLTKLYVTANRTISDAEINALSKNCPKLEKLDILGTRLVTVPSIINLLESSKNFSFLDVSFCFAFSKEVVHSLDQQYPHVSIKRSFQEDN
uniref:F-box/LRR-repeat protein 4-like n=1 Tax=Styela clava TaxID=7725 RepID=UPI001939C61F|nr:F-box/LRR-repeat protein 4-like [Styela clava]